MDESSLCTLQDGDKTFFLLLALHYQLIAQNQLENSVDLFSSGAKLRV